MNKKIIIILKIAAALSIGAAACEIGGRTLLSDAKISSADGAERYFFALGGHPSDAPLDPRPAFNNKRGFRFVILGDSTAVGFPYAPGLSFGAFLAIGLGAATGRACEWETVGVEGRSSAGVVRDLEAAAAADADCFIVYIGHNEFAHRISVPSPYGRAREGALQRLLPGISDLLRKIREAGGGGAPKGLPQMFRSELGHAARLWRHGDPQRRPSGSLPLLEKEVTFHAERFRNNINKIAAVAAKLRTPIVFIEPASNLLAPPLTAAFSDAPQLYEEGLRLYGKNSPGALEALRRARERDAAPIRIQSALLAALREGVGGGITIKIESEAIETDFIDMVHPRPRLAARWAERIAALAPDGAPRLDVHDAGQVERFRAACKQQLERPEAAGLLQNGESGGALLQAHMYLEYGNRAAAEERIAIIAPSERTFAMVMVRDLALRFRGAAAAADAELEEILRLHADWDAPILWWRNYIK